MIRMLIVGYRYDIRSERRMCEEVSLNLAYSWFRRLGLEDEVPDHSTFSKNRHGRFRESDVFPDRKPPKVISLSDAWARPGRLRRTSASQFGYGLNHFIDNDHAVIVDVEAHSGMALGWNSVVICRSRSSWCRCTKPSLCWTRPPPRLPPKWRCCSQ
jgi:hypothetical protein